MSMAQFWTSPVRVPSGSFSYTWYPEQFVAKHINITEHRSGITGTRTVGRLLLQDVAGLLVLFMVFILPSTL